MNFDSPLMASLMLINHFPHGKVKKKTKAQDTATSHWWPKTTKKMRPTTMWEAAVRENYKSKENEFNSEIAKCVKYSRGVFHICNTVLHDWYFICTTFVLHDVEGRRRQSMGSHSGSLACQSIKAMNQQADCKIKESYRLIAAVRGKWFTCK